MKRAAVIGMAAFYLLITTGMFVCIIHCSAQSLISKPPVMAMMNSAEHGAKKHCHSDKDCDCCKKHGTYVVKENIKPGIDIQFTQTGVILGQPLIAHYGQSPKLINSTCWAKGKAPPGKTGKLISIQLRSLQI